jgi:GWxTD domain-containing protein
MSRAPALLVSTLAALFAASARADIPVRSETRPVFVLNAVALPRGADSARVEITWEIPFRELAFHDEERGLRARYDVTAVLARGSRQFAGDVWEERARAATFAEARGGKLAKSTRVLVVPPGEYELRATVTDRVAGTSSSVQTHLSVRLGPTRIGLSDLRFVRYTEGQAHANPGREIPVGEGGHAVRVTLHPETAIGGEFRVRWRLSGPAGSAEVSGDSTVVLGKEPFSMEIQVLSATLSAGVHHFEVRLEGLDGTLEESRKATFFVRLTPQWFVIHREDAFEVLETLGTAEEVRALREASDEGWAGAVEGFWSGRDPDPRDPGNAFRDAIQERMEAAASLFEEPFRRPGWRTDRGRILVRFGHPQRRTVRSADFEGPASELWEYDSPRRLFFFVDERGSGEFWLRG